MRERHYTIPYFMAYFFYYAGYCVFSSFIVLYLTRRGISASMCGAITSLSLLASLFMEPVGGYIADTFFSVKRYLLLCIAAISGICVLCTELAGTVLSLVFLIVLAGVAYPFSQLMDAWVDYGKTKDSCLVYSRIRAGGSIGFALVSFGAGYYFDLYGWGHYFYLQAILFLLMIPFLLFLPDKPLGNRKDRKESDGWLSFQASFGILLKNQRYLFCLLVCTVYWLSHRPVGSFLSLIVDARGEGAAAYGMICGVGAVAETAALFILAVFHKKNRSMPWKYLGAAVCLNLIRPFCMMCFHGVLSLYTGQIVQSLSFALFYTGSVACFSESADKRIHSFCVSVGLTCSSVVGTITANLAGGRLCDILGVESLIFLSFVIAVCNCIIFLLGKRKFV